MLKKLFVLFLIGIVVFAIIANNQSPLFHVERSATIAAPVSLVFNQVNDLRKWDAWSPWVKLDPNTKNIFSGPAAGTGAALAWQSDNNNVGEGKMTITESKPNELIRFQLEFKKPFEGTDTAAFAFTQVGEQTNVTWSMDGEKNFVAKVMGLLMDCDKMVGEQFEAGLKNLNDVVAAANKK